MKTITKTYNIYNFDELKEDIQKEVIEKEKEIQQEDYCNMQLNDDMNIINQDIEFIDRYGTKSFFTKYVYVKKEEVKDYE